jgi:hypothetical protein
MTPPTPRPLGPDLPVPTPRQYLQRTLLVDCLAERTDARLARILVEQAMDAAQLSAVPGWGRLGAFVDGPLRAQLVAAMRAEDAEHVLARIHTVIACVLSPEGRARA